MKNYTYQRIVTQVINWYGKCNICIILNGQTHRRWINTWKM